MKQFSHVSHLNPDECSRAEYTQESDPGQLRDEQMEGEVDDDDTRRRRGKLVRDSLVFSGWPQSPVSSAGITLYKHTHTHKAVAFVLLRRALLDNGFHRTWPASCSILNFTSNSINSSYRAALQYCSGMELNTASLICFSAPSGPRFFLYCYRCQVYVKPLFGSHCSF